MDLSGSALESRRTEFRLLKPMPTRQDVADEGAAPPVLEPWDTQIRRLFPPRDVPPSKFPPVAGIRLGHFEIEERIARGGMGTVFRARDLRLDRLVALKVLSQEQLRDPAAVQRFQNEARAAAKLDHENIARVYFIGEDHGVHFIAFEYVRGTTVREAIAAKRQLSQDEAVNYTLQAAEALRHTEAAGVVHRDIKPSNLIVTPSGRVKLVDLGLARQLVPNGEADLTVSGTTLGTFDYISPEQARDPRNVDVRSDIYSLGCTLFHMLTGSPPYPHGTTVDKLVQHTTGRPPDPAELNPRVSPRLSLVVQRMMASNPDERYSSPQALIDELSEIAVGLGLRATAPEGTIWRRPLYRSGSPSWNENRGWIIAFAAIMLLAVGGDKLYQAVRGFRTDRAHLPLGTGLAETPQEAHSGAAPLATPATSGSPGPAVAESPTSPGPHVTQTPTTTLTSTTLGTPAASPLAGGEPAAGKSSSPRLAPAEGTTPAAQAAPLAATPPATPNELASRLARGAVGESVEIGSATASVVLDSRPPMPPDSLSGPRPINTVVRVEPSANPNLSPANSLVPGVSTVPSGSAATGVGAGSSGPVATAVEPFAVFAPDGTLQSRYVSLEAACHAARSGSLIQIDFDGPLPRPEKPLQIQGKRLTVRPVAGKRPVIQFRPPDISLTTDDVRMIDVIDGALELYDVDLVMEVTKEIPAEQWVLLSTVRPRKVELQRVTCTVHNAGWKPAVILERRVPSTGPSAMMPTTEPQRPGEFEIRDSLFRGGATFWLDRSLEPATIRITDAAVAVDGDLWLIQGADRADMESLTRMAQSWRCEVDHLTAVVGKCILHVATADVRDCPDLHLETRNSVLAASDPLVLFEGHQDSDWFLQRADWTGSRNVFVGNPDVICEVRGQWPQATDTWTYEFGQWPEWMPAWELTGSTMSQGRLLAGEVPLRSTSDRALLSDFALRPMENIDDERNPASGLSSDGSDAGFRPSMSSLPSKLP